MNKLFVIALLFVSASAWWDPSWNFSKPLTADKNVSLTVGLITLDTAAMINAGKLRYDCGDLRVVKDSLIGYYVVGCNTTYTNVFFDSDFSYGNFEMYYGNPAGQSAASTGFFSFYDGFDGYATGSDGAPAWTTKKGSFEVNYTNNSARYVLNSSSESIATSYTPSENFTVFAVVTGDDIGLMYGYFNSTHYYAAYINGSSIWVREGTSSRNIGVFSKKNFNNLWVEVLGGIANIYVNGVFIGTGNYSSGGVGAYAFPDAGGPASLDEFTVFSSEGPVWSLGSEKTRPKIVLQFVGSEAANMRTAVSYMDEDEHFIKIRLESDTRSDLVEGNSARLNWGNISFNATGFAVNGSFTKINADIFNYTQGKYRFDLQYKKDTLNYTKWHIVQFFNNYPAIKHIVFITANHSGNYTYGIYPWASCSNFTSTTGTTSCASNMRSPSGVFRFGTTSVCGLHRGSTSPFRVYENVSVQSKRNYKGIFWQSYMGCKNFMETVEMTCGSDFYNCTAQPYSPVKTLFYVNDEPGPLSRIEYPAGFSCKINGESFTELVDSTKINKGLNSLECSGNGNLTGFKYYTAQPYEATRFFGERPERYEVKVTGPITRGKIGVCGIPFLNKIFPFKCSGSNMFFEGNLPEGKQTFYAFKTKRSWAYKKANGGPVIPAKVTKMEPPQPPLAAARDLGTLQIPPTHKTISSRRFFYSNETVVEVLITAWRAV